jgi:hypothetical protein
MSPPGGAPHLLTTAEAEAEAMQSVVDRAGIPESWTPAAAARSAVDRSEHVVRKILEGDPVSKDDAAILQSIETRAFGGQDPAPTGDPASTIQSAADRLNYVAQEKLETGEALNRRDAEKIKTAERTLFGTNPPGGIGQKAELAAEKAEESGLAPP